MKYALYILIGFLLIASGCKDNSKTDEPENLIPRDTMVQVLMDIHLIEASIKLNNERKLNKEEYTFYYYQYLFEKYDITKEVFDSSLIYYQHNIERFDTIYIDVISELNRLEGEISK